ncbi:lysozyme-like domain-containing protein [Cyathus striatus]|nr:lysozyme-like domain-containing protein [Cyathus striatus]
MNKKLSFFVLLTICFTQAAPVAFRACAAGNTRVVCSREAHVERYSPWTSSTRFGIRDDNDELDGHFDTGDSDSSNESSFDDSDTDFDDSDSDDESDSSVDDSDVPGVEGGDDSVDDSGTDLDDGSSGDDSSVDNDSEDNTSTADESLNTDPPGDDLGLDDNDDPNLDGNDTSVDDDNNSVDNSDTSDLSGTDLTDAGVDDSSNDTTIDDSADPIATDPTSDDSQNTNGDSSNSTATDTSTDPAVTDSTSGNSESADTAIPTSIDAPTDSSSTAAPTQTTAAGDSENEPPASASSCAASAPSINDATINLIKQFEGFVPSPAPDPINLPTVGFGHKCQKKDCAEVSFSFPLSQSTASLLLQSDSQKFTSCLNNLIDNTVTLNDNQFGALTAFAFNVGCGTVQSSTLLKRLNAGDDPNTVAAQELPKFNKAKGNVLAGLTRRRAAEVSLFQTPSSTVAHPLC